MVALDPGYAKDVNRVYYRGKVLTRDVAHLQVLRYDYVKTASEVFHRGVAVAGADATTFEALPNLDGDADARDARGRYSQGKRLGG